MNGRLQIRRTTDGRAPFVPVPIGRLHRKCACGQHAGGGQCDECKKKHETLQRYPADSSRANTVPPVVHEVLRSPGQPLDIATRDFMEPRFGHDFSRVRVHTDARAGESARAVDALAYTVGNHIVLGNGMSSSTLSRKQLLAHELTHVTQQSPVGDSTLNSLRPSQRDLQVGPTDGPAEREAERIAQTLSSGVASIIPGTNSRPQLQRTPGGDSIPTRRGSTLPYREATELHECIRIMGEANTEFCRRQVLAAGPMNLQPGRPATQSKDSQSKEPKNADREGEQKQPDQSQPPANLRSLVRQWLTQSGFKLPLVADPPTTPDGKRRVFYGDPSTLDAVTDDVTDVLGQTTPGIRRVDVWSEVWQFYNQLRVDAEKDRWQTVVQILVTPQFTFATTQPQTPGASPWQHGLQISGGRNLRLHSAGASGPELTFQGNLSLFSLTGGHPETGRDAFQNFLLSAQLQQVWNLGREFRIGSEWSVVQASLFAQLAAGIGSSYAGEGSDRKLFVGFLAQPSAGGQVNLNIGWFQVIVQGSVVYSYLSPTKQPGSSSQHSGSLQLGLGLGAQF
jgi:hypothetical protein